MSRSVNIQRNTTDRVALKPEEHEKLVRRAIRAYLDLDVRAGDWRARYSTDVREEALERMTLDERRARG